MDSLQMIQDRIQEGTTTEVNETKKLMDKFELKKGTMMIKKSSLILVLKIARRITA